MKRILILTFVTFMLSFVGMAQKTLPASSVQLSGKHSNILKIDGPVRLTHEYRKISIEIPYTITIDWNDDWDKRYYPNISFQISLNAGNSTPIKIHYNYDDEVISYTSEYPPYIVDIDKDNKDFPLLDAAVDFTGYGKDGIIWKSDYSYKPGLLNQIFSTYDEDPYNIDIKAAKEGQKGVYRITISAFGKKEIETLKKLYNKLSKISFEEIELSLLYGYVLENYIYTYSSYEACRDAIYAEGERAITVLSTHLQNIANADSNDFATIISEFNCLFDSALFNKFYYVTGLSVFQNQKFQTIRSIMIKGNCDEKIENTISQENADAWYARAKWLILKGGGERLYTHEIINYLIAAAINGNASATADLQNLLSGDDILDYLENLKRHVSIGLVSQEKYDNIVQFVKKNLHPFCFYNLMQKSPTQK